MKIQSIKIISAIISFAAAFSCMGFSTFAVETKKSTAETTAQTDVTEEEEEEEEVDPNEIASGSFGENDAFNWVLDKQNVLTIRGKGYMNGYNDKERSSIPWYEHRLEIKKIRIDEGIKSVGFNMFRDCFYLTDVSFPSTLLKIDGRAFESCYSLKYVKIPSNVEDIEMWAFGNCNSLVSFVVTSKYTNFNNLLYYANDDGVFEFSENVTIFCKKNSNAERYARNNALKYSNDFSKSSKLTTLMNNAYKANSGYINLGISKAKVKSIEKKSAVISYESIFPWDSGRSPELFRIYAYNPSKNEYVQIAETTKKSIKLNSLVSGSTYRIKVCPIINDIDYDDEYRIIVQFKTK